MLGRHTHLAGNGTKVNVWQRGTAYLARGYCDGARFGETLGHDEASAALRLHEIICAIGDGTYVRASQRHDRPLGHSTSQRLTIRQLVDEFLLAKRKLVGHQTAADYRTRLAPLIEFAELPSSKKKWPTASAVDHDCATQYRERLMNREVARNGRAASVLKLISPHQIYNCLDCARTVLNWGKDVRVAKLAPWFVNPFTSDVVGQRPQKDPLRPPSFPLARRVQLVSYMDVWQLSHLALPLVLPMRPEDSAGLLVDEIDYARQLLRFGTRFEGRDFNKGRQSLACPYPQQLTPFLRFSQAGRQAGPLLRARSIFEGQRQAPVEVHTTADIAVHINNAISLAPHERRKTLQDQKVIVRRALREFGGVTTDELAKEFKQVMGNAGQEQVDRFYDLRGSINTELDRAGVSTLVQKYVTGHALTDILNEYVSLDPATEMQKYFDRLGPLFYAMHERAQQLGMKLLR